MEKAAGHRPKRAPKRSLDERNPAPRPRAEAGFRHHRKRLGLSPAFHLPEIEDRVTRLTRLSRAYQLMTSLAGMVWPGDVRVPRDPDAVSWRGALESLTEEGEQLSLVWRDEDHLDKYRLVAELAWAGVCESGRPVLHENGDPEGIQPEPGAALW